MIPMKDNEFFNVFGTYSKIGISIKPLRRAMYRIEEEVDLSNDQKFRFALLSFFDEFHSNQNDFYILEKDKKQLDHWIEIYKDNGKKLGIDQNRIEKGIKQYLERNSYRNLRIKTFRERFKVDSIDSHKYKELISFNKLVNEINKEAYFYDFILKG